MLYKFTQRTTSANYDNPFKPMTNCHSDFNSLMDSYNIFKFNDK